QANDRVVLGQQDPPASARQRRSRTASDRRGRLTGQRQPDGEAGADARLAVDLDLAAGLLDDPVAGREPEPGAVLLGREEGIEDVRERALGDALTAVTKLEQ